MQKENEEAISHENVRSLLFLHKKIIVPTVGTKERRRDYGPEKQGKSFGRV